MKRLIPWVFQTRYTASPALNLQWFAEENTQTTLLDGLTAEMKTWYKTRLLDHVGPRLVHDQFGTKYPIPQGNGKIIEMRMMSDLPKVTTALTEGVTPDGGSLEFTSLTAEVKQYGYYTTTSDILKLTAIDPIVENALKKHASQATRSLDTITREVLCGGTNVSYAPLIAADETETAVTLRANINATAALTPKVIVKGAAKLKRMNAAPIDDYYVAIIHPDVSCDLQLQTGWIEAQKYANPEAIYKGEIGRIGGVRFVETTEAKIIGPGWIFGNAHAGGVCRLTLKTALDATGSTTIAVNEAITTAQAAELTARITGGETFKLYVGGKEAVIDAVTAGAAGSATFTAHAAVQSVSAGAVVCGHGAGKDGSAVYCTLMLAADAYGITELEGGGLEYIVKPPVDPLNQRSTMGWKATKVAERLVEEYMLRIEHGSPTFSAVAVSN